MSADGRAVRAVFGAPLYDNAAYLEQALDSLLSQTLPDFALVLVDDCSTDETPEIARRYAAADERVRYVRNDRRLGMIGNWRRAFELARELHPEAEYFAWGSDHDLWEPRWLEALVARLDATPEAVLAYPQNLRIDGDGRVVRGVWSFDTSGEADRLQRLRRAVHGMSAGNMVYGLMRADALERAGVFRYVLSPDRLVLLELAVQGTFEQVPEVLWHRRFEGLASKERQRRAFFPDGRCPRFVERPIWQQHVRLAFREYGGDVRVPLTLLRESVAYESRRARRRFVKRRVHPVVRPVKRAWKLSRRALRILVAIAGAIRADLRRSPPRTGPPGAPSARTAPPRGTPGPPADDRWSRAGT